MIKSTRISTSSGASGVAGHVYEGKDNLEINEIQGCREDLDDMVADAERHGAKFSIRHVTISPGEATTRDEAIDQVHKYAKEFGGDASRAVVVEHRKAREGGAGFDRHWHAMIPEVQDGRVMDSSWMRPRQEKLSRVAEIELGHGMIAGRWNQAVEDALRADGKTDMADRVTALSEGIRPTSAYTSEQHQAAKAAGISMPHTKATATAAAAAFWTAADGGESFVAALATADLRLAEGTKKPGVYVVQGKNLDGQWADLGALDRLIKIDRKQVAQRLGGIDLSAAFDQARQPEAPAGATVTQQAAVPANLSAVDDRGREPDHESGLDLPGRDQVEVSSAAEIDSLAGLPEPTVIDEPSPAPAGEASDSAPTPESAPIPVVVAEADPIAAASVSQAPAEIMASDDAPAASPASPAGGNSPGGKTGAGTGGGGGESSDAESVVAPLDGSKPNDFARYAAATAAAGLARMKRAAAKELAATSTAGGTPNGKPDTSIADALADAIRELVAAWRQAGPDRPSARELASSLDLIRAVSRTESPSRAAVEPPADRRLPGGSGDAGPDRSRDQEREGPNGDRRLDVRDPPSGDGYPRDQGGREVDAGAQGGGHLESRRAPHPDRGADRSGAPHGSAGEGGHGRGESQVGRARVADRRAHRALAAGVERHGTRIDALLARLTAAKPEAVLAAALAASKAGIKRVLGTSPWPSAESRSKQTLQADAADVVKSRLSRATDAAAVGRATVEQLYGRVGIIDRGLAAVGINTPAVKAADKAIIEAEQAERMLKDTRVRYREDLAGADASGATTAARREREQGAWEDSPDVVAARREQRGNELVTAALKADDPATKEFLAREDGLRLAREALLKQEAERLAALEAHKLGLTEKEFAERMVGYKPSGLRPGGKPSED